MRALVTALALLLPALPATAASLFSVNIQPVSICTDDVVGDSCSSVSLDETYLNDIYGQIGVSMNVLDTAFGTGFNYITNEDGEASPDATLFVFASGINPFRAPNTIYVGFTEELEGGTIGFAFVDAPTTPYAIVQQGFVPQASTIIAAHEIGHILGGIHENAPLSTQLMFPTISVGAASLPGYPMPTFSASNAAAMLDSPLLIPIAAIPVPPALPLLGSGALVLIGLGRFRKKAHRATA